MSGRVEMAEYQPTGYFPKGLGDWIPQRTDLEANFPKQPGNWVSEPKPGSLMAIKISHPDSQARGQLSSERAALLLSNQMFGENVLARPVRLYGYGVSDQPYLLLEGIGGNFQILEKYMAAQGGILNETEAVKIAFALGMVLSYLHSRGYIHNDIPNIKLNSFWDPTSSQLRLIYFGNVVHKTGEYGQDVATTYGHEREALGRFLFRLITGTDLSWRKDLNDNLLAKMNLHTKALIERACYLAKEGENYVPGNPADSDRMLADLTAAKNATSFGR